MYVYPSISLPMFLSPLINFEGTENIHEIMHE